MKTLMLYLTLNCPDTRIVNMSKLKWVKEDDVQLQFTKTQCIKFYPRSPCLKTFIKRGFQNYWAICSK